MEANTNGAIIDATGVPTPRYPPLFTPQYNEEINYDSPANLYNKLTDNNEKDKFKENAYNKNIYNNTAYSTPGNSKFSNTFNNNEYNEYYNISKLTPKLTKILRVFVICMVYTIGIMLIPLNPPSTSDVVTNIPIFIVLCLLVPLIYLPRPMMLFEFASDPPTLIKYKSEAARLLRKYYSSLVVGLITSLLSVFLTLIGHFQFPFLLVMIAPFLTFISQMLSNTQYPKEYRNNPIWKQKASIIARLSNVSTVLFLWSALYLYAFFSVSEVGQVFVVVTYNLSAYIARVYIPIYAERKGAGVFGPTTRFYIGVVVNFVTSISLPKALGIYTYIGSALVKVGALLFPVMWLQFRKYKILHRVSPAEEINSTIIHTAKHAAVDIFSTTISYAASMILYLPTIALLRFGGNKNYYPFVLATASEVYIAMGYSAIVGAVSIVILYSWQYYFLRLYKIDIIKLGILKLADAPSLYGLYTSFAVHIMLIFSIKHNMIIYYVRPEMYVE